MAFTTAFLGLTITTVSDIRCRTVWWSGSLTDITRTQHWILGVRRIILATLYLPPGVTVDKFLQPPYSTDEIVRRAIFDFQVVAGDLIMVRRERRSSTLWAR